LKLPGFHHIAARKSVSGLIGSSAALFLLQRESRFIALTRTEEAARLLARDLAFFASLLQQRAPLFLPAPGDKLTAPRLAAVAAITGEDPDSVVASRKTALAPIWSAASHRRESLLFRPGDELDEDFLREILDELGYRQALIVADAGEYAFRAGLVDLFPAASEHPVRLGHSEGAITTLRSFDVDTQRSFRDLGEVVLYPLREPAVGDSLFRLLKGHAHVDVDPTDEPISGLSAPELVLDTSGPGSDAGLLPLDNLELTPRERRKKKGPADLGQALAELTATYRLLAVSRSAGEASRLHDLLTGAGLAPKLLSAAEVLSAESRVVITRGNLSGGFIDHRSGVAVVTTADLFGSAGGGSRPPQESHVATLVASLDDLTPGDTVVHVDHGVGRFVGLKRMTGAAFRDDLLELEYAGGAKLFLPPSQVGKIRRHHGGGSRPSLDRMGGTAWPKAKTQVRRKVREMAEGLLKAAAEREAAEGFAFSPDGAPYREFTSAFPFRETPDQMASMEEIRQDMEASRPMDRLLCGDVGYGKTEVAMRAAFKAVADGRQVAILVPTTLLAEQHFETFSARFAPFPVRLDLLSRFRTASERRETIRSLSEGTTDIVIGTQGLIGREVSFHCLGLLIVDEEQKFGVADKEKIKEMKAGIDVLTLSATPIPRTLQLALSGLRSLSLIESPPEERMAVRAIVAPFSESVIHEALEREFGRKGQAFFLHNRIETIFERASSLTDLHPGLRIAVAHGRMGEGELDEAMCRFHRGEADLLLCTAIVGAGLDIPRANTMIVERADTFGLADLYQFKGRVGRADVRAFAYFLTPPPGDLTPEAAMRLEAIQELSYLGAGFRLALKDLELRGAGSLLSSEQSGNIEAVGYDLYVEMLRETVAEMTGKAVSTPREPVIKVQLAAGVPDSYLDDPTLRFTLHRKIAALRDAGALNDLRRELRDRFGPPPLEVARLLDLAELKIIARRLGIARF
jgi:transcription-repair coupling factor (superfamily II helicase)